MRYIAGTTDFKLHNSVVSLGKFDGFHLGHRLLLDEVLYRKKEGYQSVIFTLFNHPKSFFADKESELIYTEEEKRFLMEKYGMDVLVSYPFSVETATMEAHSFLKDVLIDKLDAKIIIVGSDYRFGNKRLGDVSLLKKMSQLYGYELIVYDKVVSENHVVSSTLIRNEIMAGNMERVNQLLGEPYRIMGEVMHGRKIGRTLGFPTTNILPSNHKLLPPNGVYTSITTIDQKEYYGITNIGYNPTVGVTPEKRVETYLFDFDQDLYGQKIEVALYTMERRETKFPTVHELQEQLQKDIIFGRAYFNRIHSFNQ